jgi:hypothetical protein
MDGARLKKYQSYRGMWKVLKTVQNVAEISRQVEIDKGALDRFCQRVIETQIQVPSWDSRYHFRGEDRETVAYLLVLDSLNFCFWPESGKAKWEIGYESETLSGYYALAASLKKGVATGIPVIKADFLAHLSLGELKQILGGRGELQLLEERVRILNGLGRVLLRDYEGEASNLVAAAGNSAVKLVELIAERLPSFRDVAEYQGRAVYLYKRAQIFAADLFGVFDGNGWGRFTDIEKLTTFADYKVPQVLRHLGILRYDQALSEKVDSGTPLDAAGSEEVEIRANTIWAVELMREELERMGRMLKAIEIDWILWNMGQDVGFNTKPYHRTKTIFY